MPVRTISHDGQPAVELTTSALRLVAVHGFGPRLAWFGKPGGENLLLWDNVAKPKYFRQAPGKDWKLRGGHRLWVHAGNGCDETEATYNNDDAPGSCTLLPDGFTVTSAIDPASRLQRSTTVRCLADDRLDIVHEITSTSDMLAGVGAWCLTCTVPGPQTRYVVPLGDGSEWDSATITVFRCWAGHGTKSFREEQFELTDDAYVLTPRGRETKRMVRAPRGVIAMIDPARKFTFAIRTPFDSDAPLPCGANIATYIGPDSFMVEMETMGPFVSLKPGRSAIHRQEWRLLDRAVEPTGVAVLAALI